MLYITKYDIIITFIWYM